MNVNGLRCGKMVRTSASSHYRYLAVIPYTKHHRTWSVLEKVDYLIFSYIGIRVAVLLSNGLRLGKNIKCDNGAESGIANVVTTFELVELFAPFTSKTLKKKPVALPNSIASAVEHLQ